LKKDHICEDDLTELEKKFRKLANPFRNINKHFDNQTNDIEESKHKKQMQSFPLLSKSASAGYIETRKSNTAMPLDTKQSRMSGGSTLSFLFNNNSNKKKEELVSIIMEKKKKEEKFKPKPLPYNIDDWNSVVNYNKKQFELEKKMKKFQDKQLQKQFKSDLQLQVKEKIKSKCQSYIEDQRDNDYQVYNSRYKENEEKQKKRRREKEENRKREKKI